MRGGRDRPRRRRSRAGSARPRRPARTGCDASAYSRLTATMHERGGERADRRVAQRGEQRRRPWRPRGPRRRRGARPRARAGRRRGGRSRARRPSVRRAYYDGRGMEAHAHAPRREGRARMVDVGGKAATERWARARAVVRMAPEAAARVARGRRPEGRRRRGRAHRRHPGRQAHGRADPALPLAPAHPRRPRGRDRRRRPAP